MLVRSLWIFKLNTPDNQKWKACIGIYFQSIGCEYLGRSNFNRENYVRVSLLLLWWTHMPENLSEQALNNANEKNKNNPKYQIKHSCLSDTRRKYTYNLTNLYVSSYTRRLYVNQTPHHLLQNRFFHFVFSSSVARSAWTSKIIMKYFSYLSIETRPSQILCTNNNKKKKINDFFSFLSKQ